jgi:hypothetical protein
MTLSILKIYPASNQEWDEVWASCHYATFFHSRHWAETCAKLHRSSLCPTPQVVVFSDHQTALLPFSLQQNAKGLIQTYVTSPESTFGGWISRDDLGIDHLQLLVDYLLKKTGKNLGWRINPFDPVFAVKPMLQRYHPVQIGLDETQSQIKKAISVLLNLTRPIVVPESTHVLDLTIGFEQLLKKRRTLAGKYRKAQRQGIQAIPTRDFGLWQEYYRAYQDSLQRWGKSQGYTWDLFYELYQLDSPNVQLWVAMHDGNLTCGALGLYAQKHVVLWHGSAFEKYFPLRPVNLLYLEIAKQACEQGYTWLDFNPSDGIAGVAAFKESFGAEPLSCPIVCVDQPLKRLTRALLLATGRKRV